MSVSPSIPKMLSADTAAPERLNSAAAQASRAWNPFALVLAALLTGLAWPVVPRLVSDWLNDPGASHGLLIPPLVFYLIWLEREKIWRVPAATDLRGVALTAFACVTFLVGRIGVEFYTMRVSLLAIVTGLIWTYWGLPRLRLLVLPILLLVSSVPLPEIVYTRLAVPLQLLASDLSTQILQMLGATVYREGNIIHLPSISLGIEEACSGLRSLSTLATATLLVGFLRFTRPLPRLLLFAAAIPIAIGVNLMRIVGTALLSEPFPAAAEGFYHAFTGWLVFLVGAGSVWALSGLLARFLNRPPAPETISHA